MTAQGSRLEGWVEEVDTGKQVTFLSENQLLEFLRACLARTQCPEDGTNERDHKRSSDRR
jgi:hypothetical protein